MCAPFKGHFGSHRSQYLISCVLAVSWLWRIVKFHLEWLLQHKPTTLIIAQYKNADNINFGFDIADFLLVALLEIFLMVSQSCYKTVLYFFSNIYLCWYLVLLTLMMTEVFIWSPRLVFLPNRVKKGLPVWSISRPRTCSPRRSWWRRMKAFRWAKSALDDCCARAQPYLPPGYAPECSSETPWWNCVGVWLPRCYSKSRNSSGFIPDTERERMTLARKNSFHQ